MRHRFKRPPGVQAVLATVGIVAFLVVSITAAGGAGQQSSPPAAPAVSEVTFAKDIAPLAFEHCVYCHRPGEVAPFSFMTYKDVRPWARSIKQKIVNGEMPPWRADPALRQFPERADAQPERDRHVRRMGR